MASKLSLHEVIPHKTDVGALANRINLETRALHNKIDKWVTLRFALALRDYRIYRQGLQSFYHVFATIEKNLYQELNSSGEYSELLGKIWKPEMARRERAEQDLSFYYDDDKTKFITPIMPAQIEFVNHINEVVQDKPYMLIAYLHVMYLALFAGGRVMRSSLGRATGLFPQKDGLKHEEVVKMGTNFFHFEVPDEETFRLLYKRDYELLTRNDLTESQKLEIIQESKYIFEQNAKCMTELERHNLARIQGKWAYILLRRGYHAGLILLLIVVIYMMRNIILLFY